MKPEIQRSILAACGRYVRKMLGPVDSRLKALEARTVEKGDPGRDGIDGKDGAPGRDGVSPPVEAVADAVAARFERRFADLTLSWERQARDMAEKAIDRMPRPKDGEPGRDGRDFAQPEFVYDGRRSFVVRTVVNGETVEQAFNLPLVMDAGFYREGEAYEKGDGVTFAGSYWIAQKDTETKPEIGCPDWRLAVKKGRDAKAREVPL